MQYRPRLSEEEFNIIQELRAKHKSLSEECKSKDIPVEDVKHYWFKSEHFSMFVKNQEDPASVFKAHIEQVKKSVSDGFKWDIKEYEGGDKLLVVNIFDLHLGKMAWGEETGEDYDINIAKERFKTALNDLIAKTSGHRFKKVLFPVGNDIYNSDKSLPFSATTAGTPQADDTRWQKLFRTGTELITQAAIRLSDIAPVDVVTVFSNHDFERVFYLGEVLSAVFANNPNISVDNSPKARKYYKFGCCLLGLAHGHNEKPQDLPLIMAQEASSDWSNTWYREWLLGHLHHKVKYITQDAKDYRGVRVTYLTSPSAPDAWHYQKAFTGAIKGAEAFVYDESEGLVGTAVHNIK